MSILSFLTWLPFLYRKRTRLTRPKTFGPLRTTFPSYAKKSRNNTNSPESPAMPGRWLTNTCPDMLNLAWERSSPRTSQPIASLLCGRGTKDPCSFLPGKPRGTFLQPATPPGQRPIKLSHSYLEIGSGLLSTRDWRTTWHMRSDDRGNRWRRATTEAYEFLEIDFDGKSSPPSHQTSWQRHHFFRCRIVSGTCWRNGWLHNRLHQA